MFEKKIQPMEVLNFFKIISRYHRVGHSLEQCMDDYMKVADTPLMAELCKSIKKSLGNGNDFASSLAKHPDVFVPFVVGFVKVGEQSNKIDIFFDRIAEGLEQNLNLKRKIASATLMPKISMTVLFFAFLFAVYYLIPKMGSALGEIKVELPLITRVVLRIGEAVTAFWWLIPLLIFGAIFSLKYYKENNPLGYSLLGLKIPIYKDIVYNSLHYQLCSLFALCLGSIDKSSVALSYTAMAVDNKYMQKVLNVTSQFMQNGDTLDVALEKADERKIVSPEVISMIQTGIETGRLASILESEADTFKFKLKNDMETIGDKISAAVMTPSYIIMLLFFAAIEYPMVKLTQDMSALSRGVGF